MKCIHCASDANFHPADLRHADMTFTFAHSAGTAGARSAIVTNEQGNKQCSHDKKS